MILKLYKSESLSEAFTLAQTIKSCISDVKVWVAENKLQLNDNKTEILLIGSPPEIDLLFQYQWITVTSHFQMQLITLVSFLTASLHERNR